MLDASGPLLVHLIAACFNRFGGDHPVALQLGWSKPKQACGGLRAFDPVHVVADGGKAMTQNAPFVRACPTLNCCHNAPLPQVQLSLFPPGSAPIHDQLACERQADQPVDGSGHLPIFTRRTDDWASFRRFTTRLMLNGTASQGQIVRAFGAPLSTVKRYCPLYREGGASALFKPRARRRGHRLTPGRPAEAQGLLDQDWRVPPMSRPVEHSAEHSAHNLAQGVGQWAADSLQKRG